MGSQDLRLPVEFVTAVAARAATGSAVAEFAAAEARVLPPGDGRERAMRALLAGPFAPSAPPWLLEEAVAQGLSGGHEHWAGSGIELAAAVLTHPDCGDSARDAALRRCTEAQLAGLGAEHRPPALTAAVAAELRRRSPDPQPMTRELLAQPTPAQLVLRFERLADAVFDAAFDLLPTGPARPRKSDVGDDDWDKRFRDQYDAWAAMWTSVLEHHPERHARIVERTEGGDANSTVRRILLGAMPWAVGPVLLESVALADLDRFTTAVLITRVCRTLRAGASRQQTREQFADRIDALPTSDQRLVGLYLAEDGFDAAWGCQEATGWAASAAQQQWRLLLNPDQAKPTFGDLHTWRASPDDLARLGRRFAQTAVEALMMWEADPNGPPSSAGQLRWVVDVLRHLPHIDEDVKAASRLVVADARKAQHSPGSRHYPPNADSGALAEAVADIEKIIADPAPSAAARSSTLGDPDKATVHALATLSEQVLADYLRRHAGNDSLVEKALLAIATSTIYPSRGDFSRTLQRHSDPQRALHTVTHDLRRRLGGNPPAREAWTCAVLTDPYCGPDTILALPAWTALKACGAPGASTDGGVLELVTEALGDDTAAWQRLADSPISQTGPNAWLRLGDILNAARDNTEWPTPPKPPTR
jgi:hypothetical protein